MSYVARRVAPDDLPPLSPLAGRNIFVSGGTGSFGTAFVRRALLDGCRRVVVFSRDELKQAHLKAGCSDPRLRCFVGDVRDSERLKQAMRGCDVVIHAAAMKRIETCEENPAEAIRTNVLGSVNVATAAIECGADRAVLLSTDKAPAAATLYGATKFCAERLWLASNVYAAGRGTRLSAVRYGNVVGSRGSVVETWKKQADAGLPISITDARCSRFWMTLDNAVDLVCLALQKMQSGDVFIPKAPSSLVGDFAKAIVGSERLAVLGTREIGLRAAERLHETLISPDEARTTYDCGGYYVIASENPSWGEVARPEGDLVPSDFTYRSDTNELRCEAEALRRLVAA